MDNKVALKMLIFGNAITLYPYIFWNQFYHEFNTFLIL